MSKAGGELLYPAVAEYLARLPRGVDSYSYALIKGAVVRGALERAKLLGSIDVARVPECVAALVRDPPAINRWVPEVHYGAVASAIYDEFFRGSGGMDAYEQWVLEGNRTLFRNPLYRALFLFMSPERAIIGAGSRWGAFHRGSILVKTRSDARSARLRLTHPANLFAEQLTRGLKMALQAGVEAAGATPRHADCQVESDTTTVYELAWT
jgi:hypothetical protein